MISIGVIVSILASMLNGAQVDAGAGWGEDGLRSGSPSDIESAPIP